MKTKARVVTFLDFIINIFGSNSTGNSVVEFPKNGQTFAA